MKILPKLEVNVDGYNDENQETVPMAMFDKTVGELLAETDKVNQLTAENAKLREQLAILIEGGEAADELIMMLKGIVEHTASSNKVTPPGQDAARQILAKINAYHEKYT